MTVAEDVTTMEEVLVEVLVAEDAKVALTVKEVVLHQEEMEEVEKAVSLAIEVQLQREKAVLEAKEAALLQKEKAVFQTEHLDVQKVQEAPKDLNVLEEVNNFR
jgi:hypothetical protein